MKIKYKFFNPIFLFSLLLKKKPDIYTEFQLSSLNQSLTKKYPKLYVMKKTNLALEIYIFVETLKKKEDFSIR